MSMSLASFAKGKLRAPWMEKVKTEASPRRIAAVPLPWWTSQSITITRAEAGLGLHRPRRDRRVVEDAETLAAIAEGMVRAAGEIGRPALRRARRVAAATVAPAERRERSTICGDQGKPIARISAAVSVPRITRSRYSGPCARRICVSVAASGTRNSSSRNAPLAARRSRSRAYFAIGKRCPGGSGSTKWSA